MTNAERAERKRINMETMDLAERIGNEFNYGLVWHDSDFPGSLQVRFDQLTEDEARAVLTFARDSGLIAKLNERQNEE